MGSPLLLLLLACAGNPGASPADRSSIDSLPEQDVITLYRSPCYGGCPVYSVRVSRDGRMTYSGRERVRQLGTATARISRSRLERLLSELDAAGYLSFADRYRPSEPSCGRYVPDAPTVITSVKLGDRQKRIEHDHGCGSAPEALGALERRIDDVLGTGRWTGP